MKTPPEANAFTSSTHETVPSKPAVPLKQRAGRAVDSFHFWAHMTSLGIFLVSLGATGGAHLARWLVRTAQVPLSSATQTHFACLGTGAFFGVAAMAFLVRRYRSRH